jgi:hypothetical protein
LPDSANVFNELIRRQTRTPMAIEIEPPEIDRPRASGILWRISA